MPMMTHLKTLLALAYVLSVSSGCAAHQSLPAASSAPSVASAMPLGWTVLDRRVRRGVERGVRGFRLDPAAHDDAVSSAMERAWRATRTADEPIRDPEAWGRTIAERVVLDELRRQRRERALLDAEAVNLSLSDETPSPFLTVQNTERSALLHERIAEWPQPERRLAALLLDGEADSISAAAWQYRREELARGNEGTMYPQKARLLLDARRDDLEDLL